MQLQQIASEIAGKMHAENYAPAIEEGLLVAVNEAADLTGCTADEVWEAVLRELREHFYH